MAGAQPVIDLTTRPQRMTVQIDGAAYYLRQLEDLSLAQIKAVERLSPAIGSFLLKDDLTDDEDAALGELLAQICPIAIDAPDAVLSRLGTYNRMAIFRVFTDLLWPRLQATGAVQEATATATPPASPAGPTSSQPSSGSTAAPSGRGTRRRRSASSGATSA